MDPDELEDALAQAAPDLAPRAQQNEGQWDGMTATNPQTGERIIYRISPNGRGRWVSMNASNAPAQDRELLNSERGRLTVLNRLAALGSEFNRINREEPTGSFWQSDAGRGILNFLPGQRAARQRLDRMAGIESEFVRANIQPGQAGTANSVFEQELLRQMTPNRGAVGPTNSERMLGLHIERDLQSARVAEQERWLSRNPSLSGFVEHWQRREPQLRAELRRRYYRGSTVGDIAGRALANATAERGSGGAGSGGADQEQVWVRDPQTGRMVRQR